MIRGESENQEERHLVGLDLQIVSCLFCSFLISSSICGSMSLSMSYLEYFLNIVVEFVPPKPKELLRAY